MDPYDVLGVAPGASHDDIEAAYRRLVRVHHPDRHVGASDGEREWHARRMAEVTGAWRLVNDPVALARHRAARARSVRPDGSADATAGRGVGAADPTGEPFDYRRAAASEFTTSPDAGPSEPRPPRPAPPRRSRRGRARVFWVLLLVLAAVATWLLATPAGDGLLEWLATAPADGPPGRSLAVLIDGRYLDP